MNRASPPSRGPPLVHREHVAMHVLSVDEYCQDVCESKGRPPRGIPVPLWPGESVQQYEREFMRWLVCRKVPIDIIRNNPMTERKYRLQFADTRAKRSSSKSARVASRSRSRSQSRSPPRNSIAKPYQRPYSPYIEKKRRSERSFLSESERLLETSPTAGRSSHGRSRSREQPQVASVTAVEKAPRRSSNWKAVRDDDLRRRYDDRASLSRDTYRQQVGIIRRRNHLISRPGRYYSQNERNDESFPQACRSVSPREQTTTNDGDHWKRKLAKRVVSVDVFRDEISKLRNGIIRDKDLRRPGETMVRIPVIFGPGETMDQYTQHFERWLVSRGAQLTSLRDDPGKERFLWHSFACMRAGIPEPMENGSSSQFTSRHSPRSLSRSRSSSRSIPSDPDRGRQFMPSTGTKKRMLTRGSAFRSELKEQVPQREQVFLPSDYVREPNSAWIQTLPPLDSPTEDSRSFNNRARWQLLERRVILLEIFQKEMDKRHDAKDKIDHTEDSKVPAIPVPLHPGESMGLYDHRFWTWLSNYGETKYSLRSMPLMERKFRITFAYLRLNKPQILPVPKDHPIKTERAQTPGPCAEVSSKSYIGMEKPARVWSAMNVDKELEDVEQQAQAAREETCSKRARIDVVSEKVTQAHVSLGLPGSDSTICPERCRKSTLFSVPPDQESPRSCSVPSSVTLSTGGSSLTETTVRVPASAGPVCVAVLPPMAGGNRPREVEIPTGRPATVPDPKKVSSKSDSLTTEVATPRSPAATSKTNTSFATSTSVAVTGTLTTNSKICLPKMATNSDKLDRLDQNGATAPTGKVPEAIAPSRSETEPQRSVERPLISSCASSSVLQPGQSPDLSSSKPEPATVAASPSPSVCLTATESPSMLLLATIADPTRAHLDADVSPATATAVKANVNIRVIKDDPAFTNPSATKSSSASTTSATGVSDAHYGPADVSNQHDGDVMNLDGCCCTKCMRNWAKTLTYRMNQLEQNVADLKR